MGGIHCLHASMQQLSASARLPWFASSNQMNAALYNRVANTSLLQITDDELPSQLHLSCLGHQCNSAKVILMCDE
jgi:hypothetical protein